jgi:hypothetical protein
LGHFHLDVKIANFMNGELKEEVFINKSKSIVVKGQENKVCKLVKELYGLHQALGAWYKKIRPIS